MTSVFIALAVVGTFGVLYLAANALFTKSALSHASQRLEHFREEVTASRRGSLTRYSTRMPDRERFEDERFASVGILKMVDAQYQELCNASFRTKLTSAFRAKCLAVALRAEKARKDLEDEAFWAQFKPGTMGAESRYKNID